MTSNAYYSTTVPVARSQEAIRKLMRDFGVHGTQFTEDFDAGIVGLRFAKEINNVMRAVSMQFVIPEPSPAKRKRRIVSFRRGRVVCSKTQSEKEEQMARATYRLIHDWLKSQFIAVERGLITFDDVFLSHFECTLPDGSVTTVGKAILPRLQVESRPDFLITSIAGEVIE